MSMTSPVSGVVDEIVATTGPATDFDLALMLKVYEVQGLRLVTVTDVVFACGTEISRTESGPTTSTVYPVTIAFSFSSG